MFIQPIYGDLGGWFTFFLPRLLKLKHGVKPMASARTDHGSDYLTRRHRLTMMGIGFRGNYPERQGLSILSLVSVNKPVSYVHGQFNDLKPRKWVIPIWMEHMNKYK